MQQERRSERLAALAAARSGSEPSGGGGADVSALVGETDRKIAAAGTRGRGRGRGGPPIGRGGKRERSPDGSGGSSEDETSSSSSSSSSDDEKDPAHLRRCWLYATTKAHFKSTLPSPFRLVNPQVIKDPRLWPLLWETLEVVPESFIDTHQLDGNVTKAFGEALETCFHVEEGPSVSLSRPLAQLKTYWKVLSQVYFSAHLPEDILEGAGGVIIREAGTVMMKLDGDFLGCVYGAQAEKAFRHATRVRLTSFPKDSSSAVRSAISAGKKSERREGPGRGSAPGSRKCSKCGESLGPNGSFRKHNRICKRR